MSTRREGRRASKRQWPKCPNTTVVDTFSTECGGVNPIQTQRGVGCAGPNASPDPIEEGKLATGY